MTDTYLSTSEEKGHHVINVHGLYKQAFRLGELDCKDQREIIAHLWSGGLKRLCCKTWANNKQYTWKTNMWVAETSSTGGSSSQSCPVMPFLLLSNFIFLSLNLFLLLDSLFADRSAKNRQHPRRINIYRCNLMVLGQIGGEQATLGEALPCGQAEGNVQQWLQKWFGEE